MYTLKSFVVHAQNVIGGNIIVFGEDYYIFDWHFAVAAFVAGKKGLPSAIPPIFSYSINAPQTA